MSASAIAFIITIVLGIGANYLFSKLQSIKPRKKIFIESCVVGMLVGISAYLLFAVFVYYSTSYQEVIFREIARNNNAIGNLSFIVTSIIILLVFGLFFVHSTRVTGNPIENFHILLFPETINGKRLLILSIMILVLVGAEGTYRKFYIREMVAYYNQLVTIADIPISCNKQVVKRYFDAKLAQIGSIGQFYAIETKLKEIIEESCQKEPQRLRDKFSIGRLKILDIYLNGMFPRNKKLDKSFYDNIEGEFQKLGCNPSPSPQQHCNYNE